MNMTPTTRPWLGVAICAALALGLTSPAMAQQHTHHHSAAAMPPPTDAPAPSAMATPEPSDDSAWALNHYRRFQAKPVANWRKTNDSLWQPAPNDAATNTDTPSPAQGMHQHHHGATTP